MHSNVLEKISFLWAVSFVARLFFDFLCPQMKKCQPPHLKIYLEKSVCNNCYHVKSIENESLHTICWRYYERIKWKETNLWGPSPKSHNKPFQCWRQSQLFNYLSPNVSLSRVRLQQPWELISSIDLSTNQSPLNVDFLGSICFIFS